MGPRPDRNNLIVHESIVTSRKPGSSHGILAAIYGVYVWLAFLVILTAATVGVLLVPGLDRRRRWVSFTCRLLFRLSGIPINVEGIDNLPDDHCVVVANHASNLDGVILQAVLPPRFSYVIKGEMRNIPLVHFLLRRVGTRFVERFVTTESVKDARKLLQASRNGESFAIFPEGTFIEEPGLSRFHSGAFATAIKGEIPVVPLVISGARAILPAGIWIPRHGSLRIDILKSIQPRDPAFGSSRKLATQARKQMLEVIQEPDLQAAETE